MLKKPSNLNNFACADDNALLIYGKTIEKVESTLSKAWNTINTWCETAELELNVEKKKFMIIGRRKLNRTIKLLEKEIKLEKEINYLGLVIDKQLT